MGSLVLAHPYSMAPLDPLSSVGEHRLSSVLLVPAAVPPSSRPPPAGPISGFGSALPPIARTPQSQYTPLAGAGSGQLPSAPVQSSAVFTRSTTPAPPPLLSLSASISSASLSQSVNAGSGTPATGVSRITSAQVDLKPRPGSSLGYYAGAAPALYSIPQTSSGATGLVAGPPQIQTQIGAPNSYAGSTFQGQAATPTLTRSDTSPAQFSNGQSNDAFFNVQRQPQPQQFGSQGSQSNMAGQPVTIASTVGAPTPYVSTSGTSIPIAPVIAISDNISSVRPRRVSQHQPPQPPPQPPVSVSSGSERDRRASADQAPQPYGYMNGQVTREANARPPAAPGVRRNSRVMQMATQIARSNEPSEQEFRQRLPSFSELEPLDDPNPNGQQPAASDWQRHFEHQQQTTGTRTETYSSISAVSLTLHLQM